MHNRDRLDANSVSQAATSCKPSYTWPIEWLAALSIDQHFSTAACFFHHAADRH